MVFHRILDKYGLNLYSGPFFCPSLPGIKKTGVETGLKQQREGYCAFLSITVTPALLE